MAGAGRGQKGDIQTTNKTSDLDRRDLNSAMGSSSLEGDEVMDSDMLTV